MQQSLPSQQPQQQTQQQTQLSQQTKPTSLQQKIALRDEAKSLLLRQCFKMSLTKYLHLIQLGSEGFSLRQWSIIHLNTSISLHHQSQPQKSLQYTNIAIKIDPTYQKPYYRRLLLLEELGEQQLIFHDNIIPPFIQNAQINKLKQQILENYRQNAGFEQLKAKIQGQGEGQEQKKRVQRFVSQMYGGIFSRVAQQFQTLSKDIERNANDNQNKSKAYQGLAKLSIAISEFNMFIRSSPKVSPKCIHLFDEHIYKLCIQFSNTSNYLLHSHLLVSFWKSYIQHYSIKLHKIQQNPFYKHQFPKLKGSQDKNNIKTHDEFENLLVVYCPFIIHDFDKFVSVLSFVNQNNTEMEGIVKFIHNSIEHFKSELRQNSSKLRIEKICKIFDKFVSQTFCNKIKQIQNMGEYNSLCIIADSLLQLIFLQNSKVSLPQLHPISNLYCLFYTLNLNDQKQRNNKIKEIVKSIYTLLLSPNNTKPQNSTFLPLYLSYSIINSIKISQIKQCIQQEYQLLTFVRRIVWDPKTSAQVIDIINTNKKTTSNQKQLQEQQTCDDYSCSLVMYMIALGMVAHLQPACIGKVSQNDNTQQETALVEEAMYELCGVDNVLTILNRIGSKEVFMIYVKTLTILSLSNPNYLSQILIHTSSLTLLFSLIFPPSPTSPTSFAHCQAPSPDIASSSIKLLHCLITDTKQQQQEQYAIKMGVSKQQIEKAKQLQGQNKNQQLYSLINNRRKQVTNYIATTHGWEEIISRIIGELNKIGKPTGEVLLEEVMLVGVLQKLAESQPQKFYSSRIVQFMINSFTPVSQVSSSTSLTLKLNYKIGRFLSLISKKCNPNIYTYPQLQSITNCLIFIIQNAKHQLHIFESFLSIINLSSKNIQVPYELVYQSMLEQNQYIVHSCLQLINNLIVNDEKLSQGINSQQKQKQKQKQKSLATLAKIEQLAYKYYIHYKQMIIKSMQTKLSIKQNGNTNDYSHPFKIYCTILSVLMVLSTFKLTHQKIEEFQNWSFVQKMLTWIDTNNGDIGVTLFKLVLLHAQKKALPKNWQNKFEGALLKMKSSNNTDKWVKLQPFIKK